VDHLRTKRELNRGFSEALSTGFVFAAVTVLFAGAGWLLDRWLGTLPVFTIVLTILALVGHFARSWYAYDAQMRRHEDELRDLRSR
jgi:F0F1-type ATP synthase assembly protein I